MIHFRQGTRLSVFGDIRKTTFCLISTVIRDSSQWKRLSVSMYVSLTIKTVVLVYCERPVLRSSKLLISST